MKVRSAMFFLSGILLIALASEGGQPDSSKESASRSIELTAKAGDLHAEVVSLNQRKHVPLYMPAGDGSAKTGSIVEAPSLFAKQEMSRIIILKDTAGDMHTFTAGSIDIPENADFVALVLKIQIHNGTDKPAIFKVSDLSFRSSEDKEIEFGAVGFGQYLFSKFSAEEKDAAKEVSVTINQGDTKRITYLVGGKKAELPIKCSFRNGKWTILVPEETASKK